MMPSNMHVSRSGLVMTHCIRMHEAIQMYKPSRIPSIVHSLVLPRCQLPTHPNRLPQPMILTASIMPECSERGRQSACSNSMDFRFGISPPIRHASGEQRPSYAPSPSMDTMEQREQTPPESDSTWKCSSGLLLT